MRDDRHPLPGTDPQAVETGRLSPGSPSQLAVGELAQWVGRLIWFVDHRNPVGVHGLGPVEEVPDSECDLHPRDRTTATSAFC